MVDTQAPEKNLIHEKPDPARGPAAIGPSSTRLSIPEAFAPRVEWRSLDDVAPYTRNPRKHSDRQITKLMASIDAYGFVVPILVDSSGAIIAGHGRVEAAKRLGMDRVPVIKAGHLSEADAKALRIADNRLAELASWDEEALALEFGDLLELDYDVEITGFDTVDIDGFLDDDPGEAKTDPDDAFVGAVSGPSVTQTGDLWLLGDHRLLCGDALDPDAYTRLLGEQTAQMTFTDPPYNVRIDGNVCGTGKVKHAEFAMASGEMSDAAFSKFLEDALGLMARHASDGAIHYICMDWRHVDQLIAAGRTTLGRMMNLCVWAKDNAGLGTFYRSQHELVTVWKTGSAAHVNNFGLGDRGRYRTNLWRYPGVNSFSKERDALLAMHPTVKPVALIADAIRDCSKRGWVILDPFAGSGSTIIAAERTGRRAHAMEIDPRYVDVAVRRWQEKTGERAIHADTGLPSDEMAAQRAVTGDEGDAPGGGAR